MDAAREWVEEGRKLGQDAMEAERLKEEETLRMRRAGKELRDAMLEQVEVKGGGREQK